MQFGAVGDHSSKDEAVAGGILQACFSAVSMGMFGAVRVTVGPNDFGVGDASLPGPAARHLQPFSSNLPSALFSLEEPPAHSEVMRMVTNRSSQPRLSQPSLAMPSAEPAPSSAAKRSGAPIIASRPSLAAALLQSHGQRPPLRVVDMQQIKGVGKGKAKGEGVAAVVAAQSTGASVGSSEPLATPSTYVEQSPFASPCKREASEMPPPLSARASPSPVARERQQSSPSPPAGEPFPKRQRILSAQRQVGGIPVVDISSTRIVDLRSLPAPDVEAEKDDEHDGSASVTTSSLKDMNKHERCIVGTPLHEGFSGKNITGDISKLKRASTVAQKEGWPEWQVKLDDHQNFLISASYCRFQMMITEKVEVTFAHLTLLTRPQSEKVLDNGKKEVVAAGPYSACRLPKSVLAQWAVAKACLAMPPHVWTLAGQAWRQFLHHASLRKSDVNAHRSKFELLDPTLFSDVFDNDDTTHGVCATWFEYSVKHIMNEIAKCGEGKQMVLLEFARLTKTHLDELVTFQEDIISSSPAVTRTHRLVKGMLYLIGEVPFEEGSSIDDLKEFKDDDEAVFVTFREKQCYLSKLIRAAWALHAGEAPCWAEVTPMIEKLGKGDLTFEEGKGSIDHIITRLAIWKLQMRGTALPKALFPLMVTFFVKELDQRGVDEQGDQVDAENADLTWLLSSMRQAMLHIRD